MSKQLGEDQRLQRAMEAADLRLINRLLDENITCPRLLGFTMPYHLACLTGNRMICAYQRMQQRETVTRLAYRLGIDGFRPAAQEARNCGNSCLADYLDRLQEIIENSNRRRGLIYL